ncbi:hypothetical protein [Pectobacterium sp. CHL-2024]|uniref:hypothetical protein n=1 Tax=Pectobacterium sp. CHL-2024 TaxID=3377079 RepID=UPI0037F77CEE
MIIKDQYEIIEVFAIYWMGDKTYFYGFSKSYNGLIAYDSKKVKVIESTLCGDFVFFEDGVFFKPLIEEKLLDDLVEGDEKAYKRFLEILKSEERIDPDFY